MSLRKRWRSKQKQRPNSLGSKNRKRQGFDSNTSVGDDAVSEERLEFLAEKALGHNPGGAGVGASAAARPTAGKGQSGGSEAVAAELEELARGLGLGKAAEFDGEELEMAARLGLGLSTDMQCVLLLLLLFGMLTARKPRTSLTTRTNELEVKAFLI